MFNTLGMSGGWYHKQKAHSALKLFHSSRKNKIDKPQSVSTPEQITEYPLESYVTHVSHRNLQGAPTESSENSSNGRIPLRIRKDMIYLNKK